MKAEQVEPKVQFKPVQLTLETQEEVDALVAILECATIVDPLKIHNAHTCLWPFRSSSWHEKWSALNGSINKE